MGTDDHEPTNVTYLPTAVGTAPARRDPEAMDGELLSDAEYRSYREMSQREQAAARRAAYRHDVVVAAQVTKRVVTHEITVSVARAVARNTIVYPLAGIGMVAKRWWDARTGARYDRILNRAEIAGDRDELREWETRAEQAKQKRHDRAMDRPTLRIRRVKAAGWSAAGITLLLLLLGVILAVDSGNFSDVGAPIGAVLHAVAFVTWVLTTYALYLLVTATVVGVLYVWNLGRVKAAPAKWTTTTARQGEARDVVPSSDAILMALRNLNYGPLNAKVKEGWMPRWDQPPVRDGRPGRGWHAQLQLPQGVPVEEIVKRKTVLAHNLVRLPVEVWPTEPKNMPGVLDLWVADQGALSGPVAPYPLLNGGTCDYFKGVPVGVDIRGTVINGRLFEANYAIAGMMGSGKTTLIIDLLSGGVQDPLVDADVFVFAENADYDPFEPRLRSLVKGAAPENVEKCMQRLRELFSELSERGRALAEHGVSNNVTRELALKDPRLRPRIVVVDECQNLFLSEHGGEAAELALKLETTARKYAITLIWATPEPSSDSLPRKLMAVTSNKACFAIGDHTSNDAVLGTGSYKGGISAVSLEPKTEEGPGDVGTAMCRGFQSRPGLMRTFYIGKEDTHAIVARAMKLREKAGITPAALPAAMTVVVDPLDDIAAVLAGQPRVRTQEVLQRLVERNRARYEHWTFPDLKKVLVEADAEPKKTSGGLMYVIAQSVYAAIARRDDDGYFDEGVD